MIAVRKGYAQLHFDADDKKMWFTLSQARRWRVEPPRDAEAEAEPEAVSEEEEAEEEAGAWAWADGRCTRAASSQNWRGTKASISCCRWTVNLVRMRAGHWDESWADDQGGEPNRLHATRTLTRLTRGSGSGTAQRTASGARAARSASAPRRAARA